MPTYEELEARVTLLEAQLADLAKRHAKLKEWSDLNDYWIEEKMNSLIKNVDKLMGIYEEDD